MVWLYRIQVSVKWGEERQGEAECASASLCLFLHLSVILCCRGMFACIWEQHDQPERTNADITACEHIKILAVNRLWHMDTLSACFFNYFTGGIPFSVDSHFNRGLSGRKNSTGAKPCNLIRSWCRQPACNRVHVHNLWPFPLCTNTWLMAHWWAALIHIPFHLSIAW